MKAVYCRYYEGSIYVEHLWGYIIPRRGILMEGNLCALSEISSMAILGPIVHLKYNLMVTHSERCFIHRRNEKCVSSIVSSIGRFWGVPNVYCCINIAYSIWIYECIKFQLDLRIRSKTRWIKGTKKQTVIFKWTVLYKIIIWICIF